MSREDDWGLMVKASYNRVLENKGTSHDRAILWAGYEMKDQKRRLKGKTKVINYCILQITDVGKLKYLARLLSKSDK